MIKCIKENVYCKYFGLADDIPCGECVEQSKFEPENKKDEKRSNENE